MGGGASKAGAALSALFTKKCAVMVVGIDGAGKSTLLHHIKPPSQRKPGEQAPTIGCAFEELRYGSLTLTVLDMAGGAKYRNMWSNYYAEADGIVFVVDSADALRMAVSKEELHELLADSRVVGRAIPLLVFANKSDLPQSLDHAQLAEALGLAEAAHAHPWRTVRCCGLSGSGVREGWDWLAAQLQQRASARAA